MILSDSMILQEMEKGNIIIDPFKRENLNPASVDLTLAPECKIYKTRLTVVGNLKEIPSDLVREGLYTQLTDGFYSYFEPLDVKKENETLEFIIPESGYVLKQGEVYLYRCNENLGVRGNILAEVEGKSSLGRLGLNVHITAGFIDPGFEGSLVLELACQRPIRIYPNMKICQVKYARVEGDILENYAQKKGSKYMNQKGVQSSLMHKNFQHVEVLS
jgi:dCTP deaminase